MSQRIPIFAPWLTVLVLIALTAAAFVPLSRAAAQAADSCGALLEVYRAAAEREQVFFDDDVIVDDERDVQEEQEEEEQAEGDAFPASGGSDESAEAAAPQDLGDRSQTGTNIQVAGVDESDLVKTNGSEIFIVTEDALFVATLTDAVPELAATLVFESASDLPRAKPHETLLAGDKLFVFRTVRYGAEGFKQGGTQVLEIDVSVPSAPRLLRTLETYGAFVTARLVGASVRLVVTHDGIASSVVGRYSRNGFQRSVAAATLSTWLPLYTVNEYTSLINRWSDGSLVECDRVVTPAEVDSAETTVVLAFDAERGLGEWDAAGVVGAASAVYASRDSLYVAIPRRFEDETQIHRWDFTAVGSPTYRGAAEVNGHLINQFAMSEFDGHLRVASTRFDRVGSSSELTVFTVGDDALQELASLQGLGPNEQIYAVRFLGDRAYVVTFRQIDPLFIIDLSDPAEPRVAGELKIPGFSAYLHPLGDGLLLGVGQDADPRTGRPLGPQATLFDVSDPAAPTSLGHVALPSASTSPTFEHRAFTYHEGRAFIPAGYDAELFAVRVSRAGLTVEEQIQGMGAVLRTLPLGAQLHLIENGWIETHDLETLERQGGLELTP